MQENDIHTYELMVNKIKTYFLVSNELLFTDNILAGKLMSNVIRL